MKIRSDIDQQKDEILQRLLNGEPRASICRWLNCKELTLQMRLRKWGYENLKNQFRKGISRPNQYTDINKHLINGSLVQSFKLKKYLLRAKLKEYKCESCFNTEWLNKPIPLELDHINGQPHDNRLENLQLLCPNCHSLTPTFRAKNKRSCRGDLVELADTASLRVAEQRCS